MEFIAPVASDVKAPIIIFFISCVLAGLQQKPLRCKELGLCYLCGVHIGTLLAEPKIDGS